MGAVRVPHGVETGSRKGYPAGTRRFRDRGLHKGPVRDAQPAGWPIWVTRTGSGKPVHPIPSKSPESMCCENRLEAVPAPGLHLRSYSNSIHSIYNIQYTSSAASKFSSEIKQQYRDSEAYRNVTVITNKSTFKRQ
jgi:hypothetical protein